MATPYPNVGTATDKDDYNYYHSQLRITVEGSFGLLTQRWGFLRKQAPKQYTVKKTIAAVCCMCRLHNFLIDAGDESPPASYSEEDEWNLTVNGAVPFALRDGIRVPVQLMDSGHHQEDDPTRTRRDRSSSRGSEILPREAMYHRVREGNLPGRPKNRR